jgi:G3E family GTPase
MALEQLISRKGHEIDHIIIECSGLANPGPVARLFWLDNDDDSDYDNNNYNDNHHNNDTAGTTIILPTPSRSVCLNGIVTMVDASHIQYQLVTTTEASQQIAYADRIILNKVDLLIVSSNQPSNNSDSNFPNNTMTMAGGTQNNTTNTEASLCALIRQIHPTAMIQSTSYSRIVDLDWIFRRTNTAGSAIGTMFMEDEGLLFTTDSGSNNQMTMENNLYHDDHSCYCCNKNSNCPHHHTTSFLPSVPQPEEITKKSSLHNHSIDVSTITLYERGTVDYHQINAWLAHILWPNQDTTTTTTRNTMTDVVTDVDHAQQQQQHHQNAPIMSSPSTQEIFRIKGILSVSNPPNNDNMKPYNIERRDTESTIIIDQRRFIVQAVYDTWEIYPTSHEYEWHDDTIRTCKLIVIGRHLNPIKLRDGFQRCLVVR